MSLLSVRGITKTFHSLGQKPVDALRDVSLEVDEGTTLGIVGESGSGKSTIIRCIMGLERPDDGEVFYDDINVLRARGRTLGRFRREVQMIFQDPYASLNPRMTVEQLIGEGMLVHQLERSAAERRKRVRELLDLVGLDTALDRYPRSFSGGQRQRLSIARALAVRPRLLVCDEPVSSLDVSVSAQIIQLLQDMQKKLGLTTIFIAHDLALVRHLCEKVAVISNGQIVEEGPSDQIFDSPQHSYTRDLLRAVPIPDPVIAQKRRHKKQEDEEVNAHRT